MSLNTRLLNGPYSTVFDVGAFRGDFAKACLSAWPKSYVISFEPLEPAPPLQKNWEWFPLALGPEAGTQWIYACQFVPSSSMLRMAELHKTAFPYTRRNHPVSITVDTLSSYVDLITSPALLKIDVQGYELEVLRGADGSLHKFDAIVLEVSHETLYFDAPTPKQVFDYLESFGFQHVHRVDQMLHPKDQRLLQSDELFCRR